MCTGILIYVPRARVPDRKRVINWKEKVHKKYVSGLRGCNIAKYADRWHSLRQKSTRDELDGSSFSSSTNVFFFNHFFLIDNKLPCMLFKSFLIYPFPRLLPIRHTNLQSHEVWKHSDVFNPVDESQLFSGFEEALMVIFCERFAMHKKCQSWWINME